VCRHVHRRSDGERARARARERESVKELGENFKELQEMIDEADRYDRVGG
jgi:hypothetical protein